MFATALCLLTLGASARPRLSLRETLVLSANPSTPAVLREFFLLDALKSLPEEADR